MTKIEFQHAFIDAVESGRHASYLAHHAAFETARFLNMRTDADLRDVEHVTLAANQHSAMGHSIDPRAGDWHTNTGWEGAE